MGQRFKSVYYKDHPATSASKKNLKLAFSEKDHNLFQTISPLSSQEVRELFGYESYISLESAANSEGLPINTFCIRTLRNRIASFIKETEQLYLPSCTNTFINPIHATFKGGEVEPLHNWYPFLEGYSPKFVEEIIKNFIPNASYVFDPFSGTGTTPLTVARLGLEAFYCEINPLLQYLTEIKIKALTLKHNVRNKLLDSLKTISDNLSLLLKQASPDDELDFTYKRVFGESKFFDSTTFEKVLKTRTLIDSTACDDPLLADFLTVAVLSSLIPASLLKRAGDLRFKNKEENKKEHIIFEENVQKQLKKITGDINKLDQIQNRPLLVCENAKNLGLVPFMGIDAVITSPPYLNGTNYFRNTKIELWFMRCLLSPSDLSSFRNKSITAGINDVSHQKNGRNAHPRVESVVAQLNQYAYDPRIPKMVASYFNDLQEVLTGLKRHLKEEAILAIDIGDSMYGGIHVPTDRILVDLLQDSGFILKHDIVLRRRMSRNGSLLRQVLLIFAPASKRWYWESKKTEETKPYRNNFWNLFKSNLPHQKIPFSKRNWGHPLHSLCSYQGKMKPSLAFHLVKTFMPKRGILLDPFAGVGTIPFEGALQGHTAYGFEISHAARMIASAKIGKPNKEECHKILRSLEDYIHRQRLPSNEISSASLIKFNKPITDYYEERTLHEILLARKYFLENPPRTVSECLVVASLLHILHGNRPYALSRRSHSITPFAPSGSFEYRPLMPRLIAKVERSTDIFYPECFGEGKIFHQDATMWWPQEIDSVDAIITSPPFFDSTRFYLANWLRLWFCGWNIKDFHSKPLLFVDERQKAGFAVYEPVFRQARERLKRGGIMVLHLGKSKKCNMGKELTKVASKWFKVVDFFSENVEHCESHGIKDKGTVEEHQYLLLN